MHPLSTNAKNISNLKNAQLSTGPRSKLGKFAASRNAITHGLSGNAVLLSSESPSEFQQFLCSIVSSLKPLGGMEVFLVQRIANCAWKLRRVNRVETSAFNNLTDEVRRDPYELFTPTGIDGSGTLPMIIEKLESKSATGFLSTLGRYEVAIERSMYRALNELQRIQSLRNGIPCAPTDSISIKVVTENN
jgi:hypothetical protein